MAEEKFFSKRSILFFIGGWIVGTLLGIVIAIIFGGIIL